MLSVTQLQYILAVGQHRHFGRAAEECNVSQPTLSAQIQKAEDDLGVIIFDRSKKPIRETDVGRQILQQARAILKEHRKMQEIVDDQGPLTGDFHLGVIPTLAPYLIPLFVESFSKTYPGVKLKINEYKTQDIVRKLIDDELDAGLLVTPLNDQRLIERNLFYEPFYLFVADSHPLAERKRIRETDLDANSVWLLDEGHCFRDQVIRVCSIENRHPVLTNVVFESGNLETLINLVRKGRGYTLLPYLSTLHLDAKEKQKHIRRFVKPPPTREVSLVHSRSFLKEQIIEAMMEAVLEQLPKEVRSHRREAVDVIDIY